jgi:methyl coenzyme M reductase subunit C
MDLSVQEVQELEVDIIGAVKDMKPGVTVPQDGRVALAGMDGLERREADHVFESQCEIIQVHLGTIIDHDCWICKCKRIDFLCKMRMLCKRSADIRVVDRDGLVQRVNYCMMEGGAHSAKCSKIIR